MNTWLLLILSLPTENATARMRAWRTLKASGAAVLRDGVYLLPAGEKRHEAINAVARDVEDSGGASYLLELADTVKYPFAGLFDRTEDYHKLATDIAASLSGIDSATPTEMARQARKLHKAFDALTEIDFFPRELRGQVEALLGTLDKRIQARTNPDEPTGGTGEVARHNPADFQGRLWATRKHLWVDRMASAWLIRRFIDPAAHFIWLDTPDECPPDALGFDFDGAAFSHTETQLAMWVTFETLMHSFGLEGDATLQRLAHIVHYLDIGGLPVAEAAGLEGLLRGMKSRIDNDDTLLTEVERVFNDFYLAFREEKENHE